MKRTRRAKKYKRYSRKRNYPLYRRWKGGAAGIGVIDEDMVNVLQEKMFEGMRILELPFISTSIADNATLNEVVQKAIGDLHLNYRKCDPKPDTWASCTADCNTIVSRLIEAELASTYYILQALQNSTLPEKNMISFTYTTPLTGLWKTDKNNIQINIPNNSTKRSRLIMGFGPSASGKTFWAKNIIKLLGEIDSTFPTVFLSIDGGIYRETSLVYQAVLLAVKGYCIKGIDNLVVTSIGKKVQSTFISWFSSNMAGTGLFTADTIKQIIKEFLLQEKKRNSTLPISLYIPDTLVIDSPINKNYFDITNDEASWIGLCIWQHKTSRDCKLFPPYRCMGCTESGKAREELDGKRYENGAYEWSLENGNVAFRRGKGGCYRIHNAGKTDSISIFQDYTPGQSDEKIEILESNSATYKYRYERIPVINE